MSTRSILKQLLDSFFFLIAFYVFVFNCGILNPLHTNKFYGGLKFIWGKRGRGGGPIYKSEVDIISQCSDKASRRNGPHGAARAARSGIDFIGIWNRWTDHEFTQPHMGQVPPDIPISWASKFWIFSSTDLARQRVWFGMPLIAWPSWPCRRRKILGAIRSLKTGSHLQNQAGFFEGQNCGFLGALHFQHRPTIGLQQRLTSFDGCQICQPGTSLVVGTFTLRSMRGKCLTPWKQLPTFLVSRNIMQF